MNDLDFLKQKEVKEFIHSNLTVDVNRLLLNPPGQWKDSIHLIVDQILSRKRAKGKLDGWLKHPDLIFPPPLSIEQASSKATSEYKKSLLSGETLVDLTGGMGIDCLSLSEGFSNTIYVERNAHLCEIFKHNLSVLDRPIEVINDEAENFLKNVDEKVTIFLDPARRDDSKNKVFRLEDCTPNLVELMPLLKEKSCKIMVKLSPLMDISAIKNNVSNIMEIHVVAVKNDCKELLIVIDTEYKGELTVIATNLETNQPFFQFLVEDEKNALVHYGQLKKYLYEPNVAVLKAGAFKSISSHFVLDKLGKNTHLYTSNDISDNFPGKVFEVMTDANKDTLKEYAPLGFINVITRDYPISAEKVKKKYNLKDGGEYYLIGYRDLNEKANLIIARRFDQQNTP